MAAFELRELNGNIFPNKYKETDRHPDFKGEFLLNGVPHEIAIWNKEGQRGPFQSFKISPKRERQQSPQDPPDLVLTRPSISQQAVAKIRKPDPITSGRSLRDEMSDDIPFAPEWRG